MSVASQSQSSSWPGEREVPSHQDVASANELPDPAFLSDFKRNLMSSSDAANTQKLLHMNFRSASPDPLPRSYTYPLALLSNFPTTLPADDQLLHLLQTFSRTCLNHVFFDRLPLPSPSREPLAPPLRFGIGCLASVFSGGSADEARSLYSAGSKLWLVMCEVDNALVRSVEMLLAAVLLVPYGILAEEPLQRRATLILSGSLTIARRMRLHDPSTQAQTQLPPGLSQRITSFSSMLWSLWLWDVILALHSNLPLNFSPNELLSRVPVSASPGATTGTTTQTSSFQNLYRSLLQDSPTTTATSTADQLPPQGSSSATTTASCRETATLLLLAILSDSITLRRSLQAQVSTTSTSSSLTNSTTSSASSSNIYKHNPFVPLSPLTECTRMARQLTHALERWHIRFNSTMSPDILTLYAYTRLFDECVVVLRLPRVAEEWVRCGGKKGERGGEGTNRGEIEGVSQKAVALAWAVLDCAARCPRSGFGGGGGGGGPVSVSAPGMGDGSNQSQETGAEGQGTASATSTVPGVMITTNNGGNSNGYACPIWMSVAVYHAALVVWAAGVRDARRGGNGAGGGGSGSGSVRALLAFKVELEGMPWPCCAGMAGVLGGLMMVG